MARKSCYVKNLMNRDRLALTSVSKCGYVRSEQLKTHISQNRIDSYCKEKLVTKEVFVNNKNESITAYKLTDKGKDTLEKNFGVKDHYKAQSISHDVKISDRYHSITEKEQDSWKTEKELRNEFNDRLAEIKQEDLDRYDEIIDQLRAGEISMPDCAYTSETGIEIIFEVVTNNYTIAELEAKENAVEIINSNATYETGR